MPFGFSPWDLALLAVVTAMGTLLAYLPDPRWKALLMSLPFPFTLANLSLGEKVGPSHALGLFLLVLFAHLVRWLHRGLRLPIVAAIAISAGVYLGSAAPLNRFVPGPASSSGRCWGWPWPAGRSSCSCCPRGGSRPTAARFRSA